MRIGVHVLLGKIKMSEKKCPHCGLWNPPSATRCDCGFDFDAPEMKSSYADKNTVASALERAEKNLPTLLIRVIVFIIVYLAGAFAIYFILDTKPSGILLGIVFGLAVAASSLIKIKVRTWH